MTQIAQPQTRVSTLSSHRVLALATLGVVVAVAVALTLMLARGSSPTAAPGVHSEAVVRGIDAGPSAGTPSAVSEALSSAPFTLPDSPSTNLPAPPRNEAGPSTGTASAVQEAVAAR
jgi:predicted metal-binding membrane protein